MINAEGGMMNERESLGCSSFIVQHSVLDVPEKLECNHTECAPRRATAIYTAHLHLSSGALGICAGGV
jgi:hypothetical protein